MLYNLKQWIYRNIKKYVLRSFPELLIVSDKRLRTTLTLVQNNADERLIKSLQSFATKKLLYMLLRGYMTHTLVTTHT